jgi:hypothetical protein
MRITNVKEVEQKVVSGGEPDFTKTPELRLSEALNWYSYYKDPKDSKKYLIDYLTKKNHPKDEITLLTGLGENNYSNVGFVCRLTERGLILEKHQEIWLKDRIKFLVAISKAVKEEREKDLEDEKPKVNIQDRIQEQSSEFIGELEGYLDHYKEQFNAYEWMATNGVKAPHARKIISHFIPKLTEPVLVLSGKADEDLEEAYSCFTKANIKKFVAFIEQIIADANRIVNNAKVTRKPKKTKKVSVDKLISKLQYKKEDVEFKIVSINPVDIIGAKQLWVFNTKTRKLGVYNAWTTGGLSIKGTTIYGFTDNSSSKTLRKPDDVLQTLAKSTERKYKTTFDGIKATEQALTGRINSDTILLKVFN